MSKLIFFHALQWKATSALSWVMQSATIILVDKWLQERQEKMARSMEQCNYNKQFLGKMRNKENKKHGSL